MAEPMADESDGRLARLATTARRLAHFGWRVLTDFAANRGLLLAGGVGFNALLAIVPLLALCVYALSYAVDEAQLVALVRDAAGPLAPGHVEPLVAAVQGFLEARAPFGLVGLAALLVLGALAFRALADAFAVVFQRLTRNRAGNPWLAALLAYAGMLVLSVAVLALTLVLALADGRGGGLPAWDLDPAWLPPLLRVAAFAALGLTLALVYKVLPAPRVALARALVGGFSAAVLWALLLWALLYGLDRLALVGAVYAPFAVLAVVLLWVELGAAVVLLGAQVVAALERNAEAGVPWHEDLGNAPPIPGQRGDPAARFRPWP